MIRLTRLNDIPLVINADLIEYVETTPDTVIVMRSGEKMLVMESADQVIERVVQFRRAIAGEVPGPKLVATQNKEQSAHLPIVKGVELSKS
jgi:flagellar protein FlbD